MFYSQITSSRSLYQMGYIGREVSPPHRVLTFRGYQTIVEYSVWLIDVERRCLGGGFRMIEFVKGAEIHGCSSEC